MSQALVLAIVGFYWYTTAPETETLGRGTSGAFLIGCAVVLVLLGLLAIRHPGITGTMLLIISVPVLVTFLQTHLGPESLADQVERQLDELEGREHKDPSTMFVLMYGAVAAVPVASGLLFALGSIARASAGASRGGPSAPASSSGR